MCYFGTYIKTSEDVELREQIRMRQLSVWRKIKPYSVLKGLDPTSECKRLFEEENPWELRVE
jgi:hypothetical protein